MKTLKESSDNMAYELCKVTTGHLLNCQCSADKALRDYIAANVALKSASPPPIVAGKVNVSKCHSGLSSAWQWLISRTTRRGGDVVNFLLMLAFAICAAIWGSEQDL